MAAEIRLFPCLSDNFGYLIHDPASGATASVDAPEAAPVIKALQREELRRKRPYSSAQAGRKP